VHMQLNLSILFYEFLHPFNLIVRI
jgi:hypothetical protein